ncbi:ATP-binding protein [Halomonas icarae]|uniref:ATP-binding protein n=1 Tax=Halomonas icarae TaxID=2691040 RepID=A0A7X5ALC0_9GAMM|nr:ATP-binding protein [Halomonas icarae]MDR5901571.1 ATP-binding protein [Halomonas icarae]NAW11684.1 ATP-binding protein [Halomonas icarae]
MIKAITLLTRRLANSLYSIVSWLESKERSAEMQSKFVDLAPTDEADKAGVYSEAILFATNNAKVSNIALTGPYGSGKSSIIQSFLKKYRRPALHISLAAFVPEADSGGEKVSRQEIERSILQQMLYGADANKLPLSRFKRIQSPGVWSILKSLYIMLGILSVWYVFHQREDIISGPFFVPLDHRNWLNVGILLFAVTFFWVTLHHFYVASFGLSLKSISLKDVEIKPAHDDQASILNRHLDEIVYFFQSTDYDLVVIEDIDRFENPEIFVTLREINSLVNENAGVKRTVRFLYALRDDMFVNTDRTKFFEFIIPVIPIINTSNSIDMVLEQGKRLELDGRLDRQFLREVSRYLNDLRLIQNIFNEYAIYVANLETDGENLLDANKLLAILIYKNVYPRDFEQLHRGAGTLAKILSRQDKLIGDGEATYRTEIAELEKRIEVAERQTPSDLRELRQIYAMALIERLPPNVNSVRIDGSQWIPISQLASHDAFEKLIEGSRIIGRNVNGHSQQVDVSKLQSEMDSQKSYQQRKEEIESKAVDNKNKILRQVRDLRSKIAALRTIKLNELLRLNPGYVQDLFESFGGNGELARFLILEGHLDDTYYQYTTLFHSGRLSPNDNKFLIQIRAFVTPDPVFPIDNPKEVIAAMRDEDFRQSYVLNVKLVDSLLSDRSSYLDQTKKLFEFISSEFENCEEFLDAYYTSGHNVAGLLSGINKAWESLVPTVIASPNNISHVTQLVSNLPETSLKTLARDFDELPEFVAANLPVILVNAPELSPKRLECLDLEVKDLAAIKEHFEIVHVMFEKGLYELTIANLEYVYQALLGENDLKPMREKNFTTIRSTNNATLMKRVERDFDLYLRDILLELQGNSEEDAPAILSVVRHDTLDQDNLREFLERQTTRLPNLEDVPERLHSMLFKINSIESNWVNCLAFMESDGFDADSLVEYLDRDVVRAVILRHPIPCDSDSLKLRQFLINADSLSDVAYREYAHALPKPFKKIPEGLEPPKLRILIDEGKINFTQENLDALADNRSLQVLFVATNIDTYLADPENFAIDDGFREELLRSEIDNMEKFGIVELMDLEVLVDLPERSALIGPILNSADTKIPELNGSIVQSLIINSTPIETQISLFNKYHYLMDDDEVRYVLASLQPPFSEIKTGYKTPRLENSPDNRDLVSWLDSRNIISSWSEGGIFANDIRVNLYRSR